MFVCRAIRRPWPCCCWFATIGTLTKGLLYAFMGVLTVITSQLDGYKDESPQGVFVLVGSAPTGINYASLTVILAGVLVYASWRLWEGLTGYGHGNIDRITMRQLMEYRIAPIVSGVTYLFYMIYGAILLSRSASADPGPCFPICWHGSPGGRAGLAVLSLMFLVASLLQLFVSATARFRLQLDPNAVPAGVARLAFITVGRLGYLARSVLFLLISALFFRVLMKGDEVLLDRHHGTVAQAINEIRRYMWGRGAMAAVGVGITLFGIFVMATATCVGRAAGRLEDPQQDATA
jgi:hypothetical protein